MTPAQLMAAAGGRKFLITVFILAIATVALFDHTIDAATWERVTVWVLGLYGAANVTQRVGVANAGEAVTTPEVS